MKIYVFGARGDAQEIMKDSLSEDELIFIEGKLEDHIDKCKDAEIISVFVGSEVTKEHIDSMPDLKLITTRSTGFDHIDVSYAKERGVVVTNVPAYGVKPVAEFTFALLLTLARKTYEAYDQVSEEGSFDQSKLEGFNLFGKTLGVVGTGQIGSRVIEIAKGFKMNVLAYDAYPNEDLAKSLYFKYVGLDELLAQSDIVTLHVPHNEHTHHLLNKDNLSKIKEGAYIINTSRGGVMDTEALVEGLNSKRIAGAALDVLEEEIELKEESEILEGEMTVEEMKTIILDHVLIDMPNVIVTPHIAFFSKEAHQEIIDTTVKNIKQFQAGDPINLVSNEK